MANNPYFKTAVPEPFDCVGDSISFGIQQDSPDCPRLIISSSHGYICQTGILHRDDPKRIATAMIAAARLLYPFTDEEVSAIQRKRTWIERALSGEKMVKPDGETPSQQAFIS